MGKPRTIEEWTLKHLATQGPDFPSHMGRTRPEEPKDGAYQDLLPTIKGTHWRESIERNLKRMKADELVRAVYKHHPARPDSSFGPQRMKSLGEVFGKDLVVRQLRKARKEIVHRKYYWLTPLGMCRAMELGIDPNELAKWAELESDSCGEFIRYLEQSFSTKRIAKGKVICSWTIPASGILTIYHIWLTQRKGH